MDDIVTEVNTEEKLVEELQGERNKGTIERSIEKNPLAQAEGGLSEALIEMTKRGVNSALFQGVERCIRVIDKGSAAQRHCMAMMVTDSINGKGCTRCNKQPNPGVCKPTTINSSMIKLNDRELKECGLDKDPTYVDPKTARGVVVTFRNDAAKQKAEPKVKRTYTRRPKVAVPNAVKIEVTMAELAQHTNIIDVLLRRTLEAVYELPITKFSEAEAIRGTSERIKVLLAEQGVPEVNA